MIRFLFIFLAFFIGLSNPNLQKKTLDSLYSVSLYSSFLDQSVDFLKENPEYKNDFGFLLKLAMASFKMDKYDQARQIFGLAAAKDSLLNDYINFHDIQISLILGDTALFYNRVLQAYMMDSENYLNLDLLRQAVNLTNVHNDTTYFIQFADLYSRHRKLQPATAFKQLNLLRFIPTEGVMLQKQIDFLKDYAESDFAEVIIDSIYYNASIDSLKNEELFYLIRAAVQTGFKGDSLIQYYDRIEHIDENNEVMLDYLLTDKRRSNDAINYIQKVKKSKGQLSHKLARSLPRLLNRKNQTQAAYKEYLEYARYYPDHPFSLNAVTFVLGRTEKSNPNFFIRTMNEFTERKSRYKQYYRFRHVLHYYERNDNATALRLIDRYLKGGPSNYQRARLEFWRAKILFEVNRREDGFLQLEKLAKNPFHSYYNMKSYVSLLENKRDSLIPNYQNVRSSKLHADNNYFSNYRRLSLVREIFDPWFQREELKETKLKKGTEQDYHSLISFYQQNNMYHKAFRLSFDYLNRIKTKTLIDKPSDIYNYTFPQYYRDEVRVAAKRFELDSSLIWAVIYRESAFQEDAQSAANAHGLMQLLPSTGKQTAERLGMRYESVYDLYNSGYNVMLGSYHLRELMDRFDNKIELALAAYNAGASRVNEWKKNVPVENMELFIEKIPFEQTRTYVKKIVFAYYAYRILDEQRQGAYYSGIKSRK